MSAPRHSDETSAGMVQAVFTAPCPSCDNDADWYAGAHIVGDLSRTDMSYRIDCPACTDEPVPTARVVVPLRPVSQLGWLGRSA